MGTELHMEGTWLEASQGQHNRDGVGVGKMGPENWLREKPRQDITMGRMDGWMEKKAGERRLRHSWG